MNAVIAGLGHALPARRVTNDDLAAMGVDTTDEWVVQRTGIRERRLSQGDEETTSALAAIAATEALANAGLAADEIDLIVLATISGDFIWPSSACQVQTRIGAKNAGAFDVSAACAGFVHVLDVAAAQIESGRAKNVLAIGADTLSRQLNWKDRTTCILFGDAAGAAIIRSSDEPGRGILQSVLCADGSGAHNLLIANGGTRTPTSGPDDVGAKIYQNGREVYKFAITAMPDACSRVLAKAGLTAADVQLFVPHQANIRIIEAAAERLDIPMDKVFTNVHQYGNTSGASVPLALYEAERAGRIKTGDLVLTVGFGGGLVWGANLIRW
jgi:3-oxoacyl-[acyl-carrier-protein] synthase-3